jgi:YidC/Oxa1 family membrane protein insertase
MEQQIRMIAAAVLSVIIITAWQYFFVSEPVQEVHEEKVIEQPFEDATPTITQTKTVEDGFRDNSRVKFQNDYVSGSINLIGAQIDDLMLKKYDTEVDNNQNVTLLSPDFSENPNIIRIDWRTPTKKGINDLVEQIELPKSNTLWSVDSSSSEKNILIHWTNSQGIAFKIEIFLDDKYMFDIKTVIDSSNSSFDIKDTQIRGHVSMQRTRNALISDNMILHEGAIGVSDGKLKEVSFSDLQNEKINQKFEWLGFSDKYWLVAAISKEKDKVLGSFTSGFSNEWDETKFQMDMFLPLHKSAEKIIQDSFMIFAGAKSIEILDHYENKYNIQMFDRAVDLGFLYFITKPIFLVLNYFYKLLGNFGLAIMLLTVLTKILLFPLAYKSVKSMNNIKKIQPKITKLKEQYAGNNMLFQQALVTLYKKEKVNPASGCLPIILQMPIFFALYKVLYVTIEMRHAPFFLWIHDLSAPDSTTIFNLFGLIPWEPPLFLMIGVLPIAMSLTMFLQQMMNPQPTDPTQAFMMKLMPIFLLFMFAQFPSGLLLYWTWSNIISIGQQFLIKYLPE